MQPDPQISCTSSTYRPARVRISDYDPAWPLRYAEEETLLREALGSQVLAVEHSDDPRRYTAAKHEFVKAVERRAGVR